jgi:hypothetical protein
MAKDPSQRFEAKHAKERYVSLGGTSKRHLTGHLHTRATIDSFVNYCINPSSSHDHKLFTALYEDQEHIIEINSPPPQRQNPSQKSPKRT